VSSPIVPRFAEVPPVQTSRPVAEKARRTVDAHDPARVLHREPSWLEFSARVLEEARDTALPAMDRLRLVSLFSSKVDELFAVRVAGLKRRIGQGLSDASVDGLLPGELLDRISARTRELLAVQHATWRDAIVPALASAGVHLVAPAQLSPEQREVVRHHFAASVFPALTPLAVDPGHPFPHLHDRSLSLALSVSRSDGRRCRPAAANLLAVVELPTGLPRLVPLPCRSGEACALLEEVIAESAADLFPGHTVGESAAFRVTRRRDVEIDEEGSTRVPSSAPARWRRREGDAAVRLEVSAGASGELEAALAAALRVEPRDVYRISLPLQVADLLALDRRRGSTC
jgi:polyphosphate kinase